MGYNIKNALHLRVIISIASKVLVHLRQFHKTQNLNEILVNIEYLVSQMNKIIRFTKLF